VTGSSVFGLPSGFLPFGGGGGQGGQTTTEEGAGTTAGLPEVATFVGPTIFVESSGGGSALGNVNGLNLETGSGTSELDAAFLCKPNYITSRLEDHVVYLRDHSGPTLRLFG